MRDTVVYGVGELFAKGPEFVLLPLYTALLAPSEYGVVSLAAAITVVLRPLLSCGLQAAALKGYFDHQEDGHRKSYYSSLLFLYVALGGALYAGVDAMSVVWARWIPETMPYGRVLRFAIWTAYFGAAFVEFPKEVMRAAGRPIAYGAISATAVVTSAVITVLTVPGNAEPAAAAVQAVFYGVLATSVVGLFLLQPMLGGRLDAQAMLRSLAYGLPLIPHFLSHWILSAANRVLIARLVSTSATGVYTAAYLIGWSVSLIKMAMTNSLIPIYGKLRANTRFLRLRVVQVTRYYSFVMGASAALIIAIGDAVLRALGAEYRAGSTVIPWTAAGAVALAMYNPSVQLLNVTLGRARVVGLASLSAALVNVALSLFAIPRFGIAGAAAATMVAYTALAMGVWWFAQRALPLPYEYGRIALAIGIPMAGALGGRWIFVGPSLVAATARMAIVLAFCAVAVEWAFTRTERTSLVTWLRSMLGRRAKERG